MSESVHALPRPNGARLYLWMALISAVIVFVGFAPSFYLNGLFTRRSLDALRIVHGVVFTLWLVLLVAQTSLVAAKRSDMHRRLGWLGGVLAALMVAIGLTISIEGVKHGFQTPGLPPRQMFLVVPFFDMLVFGGLIAAALGYRRRPAVHKRLMILATIALLPAPIARIAIPGLTDALLKGFGLSYAVLLACILCDAVQQRRLHRIWLWGGGLIVVSLPLRLFLAGTPAWQSFAGWLAG
jgi:hypothetical protein